uniref:Protein Nef n=1 Tax=Human immunodeficiency virus type 1 TaxID=11676 RepID=Q5U6S1_HV1|nr:nef protein [Human immunodeficiency virus 1]
MGGKWSKRCLGWMACCKGKNEKSSSSRRGGSSILGPGATMGLAQGGNTSHTNPDCAWHWSTTRRRGSGFSSQTSGPVKTNDLQGSFRYEPLFKRKGGTEGLIWSKKRQEILDLWVIHTQGYFPDWQNYTPGPGIRYPLTFGWCFELVPVDPKEVEEATEGENNSLLHPMCQHGMDDTEREVLMWRFNSRLAFEHKAKQLHPEYYKDC